ncbi:MAG TPA: ABC transporter permease [Thermoanaerobaculia bacterium]|nr:ABC transporter permease [Thermoanaerobaculia bacterium]
MSDRLRQDLRSAFRQLRLAPGFAAIALITLAFGIGATVAIWSVMRAVVWTPLPYRDPGRLVLVWNRLEKTHFGKAPVSAPDFLDYRAQTKSFAALAATNNVFEASLTAEGGEPEQVKIGAVTANFFDLLGTPPLFGRTFLKEDETPIPDGTIAPNADPPPGALVLSYGFFHRRFGGDPKVIGRTVRFNDAPLTVVGVMRPDFALYMPADAGMPAEIQGWTPLRFDLSRVPREQQFLRVLGRLAPGVSLGAASREMDALAGRLRTTYPFHRNMGMHIDVVPLHGDVVGAVRPALAAIGGAVACVLLIACANLANLLLARATSRRREMAVRAALGASRPRLIRQSMTEALLLALGGAALGLLLAKLGLEALVALAPPGIPRLAAAGLDGTALACALGAAVISALAFGLAPAVATSLAAPAEALRGGAASGGRSNSRRALVVAEVAITVVLLAGAGLLLATARSLGRVDLGFAPKGALTFTLQVPFRKYPQPADQIRFHRQLEARLAAIPGVANAGSTFPLPLSGRFWTGPFGRPDQPQEEWTKNEASLRPVSAGLFQALGLKRLAGRFPTRADEEANRPLAVVDRTLADQLWPGTDPIGRRLGVNPFGQPFEVEVAGVVAPVRHMALATIDRATVYFPLANVAFGPRAYVVRAKAGTDPASLTAAVRAEVARIDPAIPIANVRTLEQAVEQALAPIRFALGLLALFAALALSLAALGLYGLLAWSVRQRTREIGIRAALGADRRKILGLIVGEGTRLAAIGIALGLGLSLALGRLIASQLHGVAPGDPTVLATVAAVVAGVALWASWFPALRAAGVDPARAVQGG